MGKSNAFTLAEVLITLGIIGIVAAMTMPNLIANYQRKSYATQLKKSVNTVQNACKMALADEEVSDFYDTTLARALINTNGDPQIINKYFKTININPNSTPADSYSGYGNYVKLTMADGADIYLNSTIYGPHFSTGHSGYYGADMFVPDSANYSLGIYVDVNGSKKLPNMTGIDLYAFNLNSNCNISLITDRNCSDDIRWEHGAAAMSCFADIVKNNWEIKYKFPTRKPDNHNHSHSHYH